MDFERAQRSGNYAALNLFSTPSGPTQQSDKAAEAKVRILKALNELGGCSDNPQ